MELIMSQSNSDFDHTVTFIKAFLTDKEIEKPTRQIIGRVIDIELRKMGQSPPRGIKKEIFEIVDGIAQYVILQEERDKNEA